MPLPTTPIEDLPRDVRVTLTNDQYLSEYDEGNSGRFKAGTVMLVDERTARRWLQKGIARPAAETDQTQREQKAAEIARLQADLAQLEEDAAQYRNSVDLQEKPVRRGPGRPPAVRTDG